MEKGARKRAELAEQNDALTSYLEALLAEVGFGDDDDFELDTLAAPVALETEAPELPTASVAEQIPLNITPAISSRADVLPMADLEASVDTGGPPNQGVATETVPTQAEPPEWVQDRLQYLSFYIGGMMFAAPLEQLNGILPWDGKVTALPGRPSWFLGLLRNRDRNVQLIDIGGLLQRQSSQDKAAPRFLLTMGNGSWAVVCDRVADVVRLNTDDIQWRAPNKKVPFVIGTAPEKMCAIFDVPYFVKLLNSGGF